MNEEERRKARNKHIAEVFEELQKTLTLEEIAESFFIPAPEGTPEEERRDAIELADFRRKRKAEMTEETRLGLCLYGLKGRLEDYVNAKEYNPKHTFGAFLKEYLKATLKKNKELASELGIHETLLSQLINSRRLPNEDLLVYLEMHSDNIIPAINMFRLVGKEKEYQFVNNIERLRKRKRKSATQKKTPRQLKKTIS